MKLRIDRVSDQEINQLNSLINYNFCNTQVMKTSYVVNVHSEKLDDVKDVLSVIVKIVEADRIKIDP